MIVILIILSLLLGGYSLYLIKKLNKETNAHLNNLKIKLHEKSLYLLDELDEKIKINEGKPFNKSSTKYKSVKARADKKFGKKVSLVKNMWIAKQMKA